MHFASLDSTTPFSEMLRHVYVDYTEKAFLFSRSFPKQKKMPSPYSNVLPQTDFSHWGQLCFSDNIALDKETWESSTRYSNLDAYFAVDGDKNTNISTARAQQRKPCRPGGSI